ncbi:hypothetical protein [Aequorivita capsosiphonis]|uniref:hypothetical protein n=1 Tax=Aequorivita capsosiphonis TaxID=487317 RepID=UPI000407F4FD|nr:hypothetical protein [Aequorivita capsosiphonis]
MNYEYRICCFIDILGFSNHINSTIDEDEKDVVEKINNIKRVIDIAESILIEYDSGLSTSKMVTQFSDSFVVSFKIEERSEVFYSILDFLHIAFEFANKGYLTRGGISVGKLLHTDKYVFGPALVSAYKLESKIANFPRIILDPDVMEVAKNFPLRINSSEEEMESLMGCLNLDSDGYYYIDYIESTVEELDEHNYDLIPYLTNLKKLIEEGLRSKNKDVLIKNRWLKEKYNSYIIKILDNISDWDDIDGDVELLLSFKNLTIIK